MNSKELRKMIEAADAILIGAGAGMSVPAGIDLMSKESFAKNYPAMLQYGFTFGYQLMGYPYEDDRLRWGYLSQSLYDMSKLGLDPSYQRLLHLVEEKDYFVITSNVDRLFEKNGFSTDRLYTPQGDSFTFQCKIPCHNGVWDAMPAIEEMVKHINPETQYLTDESYVPRCPVCGGKVYMNVRSGAFYIEKEYDVQRQRLNKWLKNLGDKQVLILEIGVGYNTPGVIRYPFENLFKQLPKVNMIRINPSDARVPQGAYGMTETIESLLLAMENVEEVN